MRKRFKQIFATNHQSEEYKVHSDHEEVKGDVDGAINDHKELLDQDQACIEQILNVDSLDSSNTATCNCDLCGDGKPTHNLLANRIMNRIISV